MKSPLDRPRVMRAIVGVMIIVSVVEWVAAAIFGWVNLVAYVSHLSQLAITLSLIPWWQGLRLEVQSTEADVPADIVSKLVDETTLEKDGST